MNELRFNGHKHMLRIVGRHWKYSIHETYAYLMECDICHCRAVVLESWFFDVLTCNKRTFIREADLAYSILRVNRGDISVNDLRRKQGLPPADDYLPEPTTKHWWDKFRWSR